MSTQRPRRIGLGTEPQQAKSGVSSEVAVQEEGPKEVSVEAVVGDSNGGGLETKALQILDSEPTTEAEVVPAVSAVADSGLPEASQGGTDLLAELLKESAPKVAAESITPEAATEMGLPAVAGADGYTLIRGKQYAIGIDHGDEKSVMAVIRMGEDGLPDELVKALDLTPLGQLANGEYRATVRIHETYVEGCRQQAESDGISLEDWLTSHLGSYLENWWGAPGSR